jgi:hypothetical protein
VNATRSTMYKCPHCGFTYNPRRYGHDLTPVHAYPSPDTECPGSKQVPRNAESDFRPLWKDEQPTTNDQRPTT